MNTRSSPAPQEIRAPLLEGSGGVLAPQVSQTWLESLPSVPHPIYLTSVVERLGGVPDGQLIQLIEPAWAAIVDQLAANPASRFQIPHHNWEELVAAGYKAAGCDEVILTPRSADGGRDVIATWAGFARIRIIDQVKAFSADRVVTADDVRALIGVLHLDPSATKGMVTTTARFAPRIAEEGSAIARLIPYRLELIDGETLVDRFKTLRRRG